MKLARQLGIDEEMELLLIQLRQQASAYYSRLGLTLPEVLLAPGEVHILHLFRVAVGLGIPTFHRVTELNRGGLNSLRKRRDSTPKLSFGPETRRRIAGSFRSDEDDFDRLLVYLSKGQWPNSVWIQR
jgi:hypothetical protein